LIDGDYNKLIKTGTANENDLNEAWERLYNEYADLIGSTSYKVLVKLTKEIGLLTSKIEIIRACCFVLLHKYSEKCIKELKKQGFNYKFDYSNKITFEKEINEVLVKSKYIGVKLNQKIKELNDYVSLGKKGVVNEKYFIETLIILSKYMGYRLDANEITVSEFAAITKKYNIENKIKDNG